MTKRGGTGGSAAARWFVSALALAATLVLWVVMAQQVPEEPPAASTNLAAMPDAVEPIDVVDVMTSASGRRLR
jgi:hypothetical protein